MHSIETRYGEMDFHMIKKERYISILQKKQFVNKSN
jgi:hypothetical protein